MADTQAKGGKGKGKGKGKGSGSSSSSTPAIGAAGGACRITEDPCNDGLKCDMNKCVFD